MVMMSDGFCKGFIGHALAILNSDVCIEENCFD